MSKVDYLRTLLLGLLFISATMPARAQQGDAGSPQKPLLEYSIVGSSSCDTEPCYSEVMKSIPVQRLLLGLANSPLGLNTTDAAFADAAEDIPDLLALRLIRREGDLYFLNFALFTAADEIRIREVSERYAESLAGALLARREEIETMLRQYDAPGVDPKAVAYFLLGCVSLDWDGLDLTAAKGYRKTSDDRPDGKYVPAAQQKSDLTLQRIFWGSHNKKARKFKWSLVAYDEVYLTSFGDHHTVPRYMLPDLLWRKPGLPSSYPDALKAALQNLPAESLGSSGYQFGRIMLALRDSEQSSADLARAASAKESEAKALLGVLVALDYVSESNGLYRARIPVLTERDEAMTGSLRAIGNQVMDEWLAENYENMKVDLKDLNFTRSGVPFSEGFTMVWHYLFGIANRKLVEAGLFADPYATIRRYKGAIPAVYSLVLR